MPDSTELEALKAKYPALVRMLDKAQHFVVIINCVHERGDRQTLALAELNARGLWLSDEQKVQAGLEAAK